MQLWMILGVCLIGLGCLSYACGIVSVLIARRRVFYALIARVPHHTPYVPRAPILDTWLQQDDDVLLYDADGIYAQEACGADQRYRWREQQQWQAYATTYNNQAVDQASLLTQYAQQYYQYAQQQNQYAQQYYQQNYDGAFLPYGQQTLTRYQQQPFSSAAYGGIGSLGLAGCLGGLGNPWRDLMG